MKINSKKYVSHNYRKLGFMVESPVGRPSETDVVLYAWKWTFFIRFTPESVKRRWGWTDSQLTEHMRHHRPV